MVHSLTPSTVSVQLRPWTCSFAIHTLDVWRGPVSLATNHIHHQYKYYAGPSLLCPFSPISDFTAVEVVKRGLAELVVK